jgi:hypothetical protein
MSDPFDRIRQLSGFKELFNELHCALSLYWTTAAEVLQGGGISVLDPPEGYFSLENNFFSALFLYSYRRLEIPRPRRVLYAAINQCFRGMVTGCDNLLDDEYKRTLETDLPAKGWRFRSVLDIMVSEHVLFHLLVGASRRSEIPDDRLLPAIDTALRTLTRSGAQEAGEEGGTAEALPPETILNAIHHYKTGILFQSPWALPAMLEPLDEAKRGPVLEGLYRIGMGCQVLDDLVDLHRDALQKRHNYVASLIYHHQGPEAWADLREMTPADSSADAAKNLIRQFPEPIGMAVSRSRQYLNSGIRALLDSPSPRLVQTVISILARRIGAETYLANYP